MHGSRLGTNSIEPSSIYNGSVIIIVECLLPFAFPLLEPLPGPGGGWGKEMVIPGYPTTKQVQCKVGLTEPRPPRALAWARQPAPRTDRQGHGARV